MKIKDYIEKQGLTVQIFADLCGISRHTIYSYIEGKRVPSLETALIINLASKGAIHYIDMLPENFVSQVIAKYDDR